MFSVRVRAGAVLLAISLLMTAPAWATLKSRHPLSDETSQRNYVRVTRAAAPSLLLPALTSPETDYAEVMRAIETVPDVIVVPILVAGPVIAAATSNLANMFAQASGAGNIAVIYPNIGEPYRSVFTQIVGGIEDRAGGRVTNFAVGANVDTGELNKSLRRQNTRVVIALGRQGVKVAAALDSNISVVVGAVLTAPENEVRDHPVNSLSPDPALLFRA